MAMTFSHIINWFNCSLVNFLIHFYLDYGHDRLKVKVYFKSTFKIDFFGISSLYTAQLNEILFLKDAGFWEVFFLEK